MTDISCNNTIKTEIGRLYQYGDKWVPSVTTILEHSKPLEQKTFLSNFKANNGQYIDQAISGGIKIHSFIEDYLKHGTPPSSATLDVPEIFQVDLLKSFEIIKPFLDELTPLYLEKSLVNLEDGYAGTVDFIGEYQGEMFVFDWKTSLKYKDRVNWGSYPQQIAAYIQSANKVLGLNITQGKVIKLYQDGIHKPHIYNLTADKYPKALEKFNASKVKYYNLLKYLLRTNQL